MTQPIPKTADEGKNQSGHELQSMLDSTVTPRTWIRNLVASIAAIGVALIILTNVNGIQAQGGGLSALNGRFWPMVLAVSLIVIAVGIVVVPLVIKGGRNYEPESVTMVGVGKLVVGTLLVIGFVMTWGTIQFGVSTAVVAAALTFIFGGRNLYSLVVFPAALGLVFHFLFIVALKVPIQ